MSGLLAAIAEKILAWIAGLIATAIKRWNDFRIAKDQVEKSNQEVLDVTEKAVTKEERDHAAEEIIRRF